MFGGGAEPVVTASAIENQPELAVLFDNKKGGKHNGHYYES